MIRFWGAVFVIFSTGYFGFEHSRMIQKRIKELGILKRIFTDLYSDVEYGACTLAESFTGIGKRQEGLYQQFLMELCREMEAANGKPFEVVFSKVIHRILKESSLHEEDKRQLRDLGKQLGNQQRKGQLRILQLYIKELEHTIEELEESKQDKQKLSRMLGIASGVLIVILLL